MKRFFFNIFIPWLLTTLVFPAFAQDETAEAQKLKTPAEELSYVLGMDVGNSLKRFDAEINLEIFMEAMQKTLKGEETRLTPERAREVKQAFFQQRRQQQAAEREAAGEKNLAEGEAFLAEHKTKEGVITTASGLQYQVVKEGEGPKPKATDTVSVHYRGTLIDGTEFDSSHKRGKPATFPVKGVIPGWTEALQLMPVGSTYKLVIPAKLAYGERGAGRQIGPNSTLIFEVELLEIAAAEAPTAAPAAAPPEGKAQEAPKPE
jgi:FKBP-type peptidyl-prolyl cis-trans isomerase